MDELLYELKAKERSLINLILKTTDKIRCVSDPNYTLLSDNGIRILEDTRRVYEVHLSHIREQIAELRKQQDEQRKTSRNTITG
jgi:hypothetical protein